MPKRRIACECSMNEYIVKEGQPATESEMENAVSREGEIFRPQIQQRWLWMRLGLEMVDNRWLRRRHPNSALRNVSYIPPFGNPGTQVFCLKTLSRHWLTLVYILLQHLFSTLVRDPRAGWMTELDLKRRRKDRTGGLTGTVGARHCEGRDPR